jgi:hypothetical protein
MMSVLVLPDQVDGLGHRSDKAAQRSAASQPLALRRHRGRVTSSEPVLDMVFSIVSQSRPPASQMSAQHRQSRCRVTL